MKLGFVDVPRAKAAARQTYDVFSRGALLPCFYCGVDTAKLKIILFCLIGTLVLGSVCLFIWFYLSNGFSETEKTKFDVFVADKRE